MRNRKIVIGDVHGCLDELRELIGKIGPSQDDHLFFVGDLIDKGPFSSQVVDLVQSKCSPDPGPPDLLYIVGVLEDIPSVA